MTPTHRETVIAAPMSRLRRYLMRRGVVAVLGQPRPGFRLRDVFKSDRIVLVALNDALVGPITAQLIGGLICAEVFSAAQERAQETNPKQRPGMVFVDEVASFLHLPVPISTALEVSRSYGVGWHLFGQGRYQLSSSLAQAFEINARSKLTFATTPSEARDIVESAPMLTADDVQSLPKYEIYANLLTPDGPSGWFSARTLPPPAALGHRAKLRREARSRRPVQPAVTPHETTAPPQAEVSHVRRRRA
ncbi:hypothetical protein [Microbacterium proteolyticum]|uniref:hypothetical protein n=1 Tax=Microbacterium proteolyticum TaxID=1572644 RepID=UPI001FADDECA|nr:hypothetical protein [Microbacterium proteolyticum]MCI9857224.1 hypothetical protein [Microbacterium proteolyticum]